MAFFEIGVEGIVHAAEKGGGDFSTTELSIFYFIDVSWHPAAADEGFVNFFLFSMFSFILDLPLIRGHL